MASPTCDQRTGLDPDEFLRDYWQRRPVLLRAAFPDFRSPVSGDDLAGLACRDDALSRLVRGPLPDGGWRVTHGPLEETDFADLPERDWTLLVQDLDRWDEHSAALLDHFEFLPGWRLDDIMASFAVPGGSVGAHADRYDVFLVQAEGRRRWLIDAGDAPDLSPREGLEMNLLQRFVPTDDLVLEPGDVLYLPPGVPHHGVALDPCITLSVGLRAPAYAELLVDLAESLAERFGEADRLTDTIDQPVSHAGEIDAATLDDVRARVRRLLSADDAELGQWFGSFVTRYRLPDPPADPDVLPVAGPGELVRNPWARWAWYGDGDGAVLFVDGRSYRCSRPLARLLTGARRIDVESLPGDDGDRAVVESLLESGALLS